MDLEADEQIGADKVWAEDIDGTGVTVAVLDTGVQSNHVELSDSIVGCKSFVAGETCEDYNGHGTHVAGIITANGVYTIDSNKATGVAPGAEVYMLKVCGEDGYCHEDDMMAAMEYVVLGPDGNLSTGDELPAKVMSISIGGGSYTTENCDSDPLAAKVNWVVDNGIVVSVAAGNDGKGVSSPGCASGAITVGAVDKSGYVPYWSGRGPAVDIVAPGADILSTYSCLAPGAEDCTKTWYAYKSGTSMATPHIAGVAALLLQAKPDATVGDVETALYDTTSPVSKCYKCTFWWGSYCFGQAEVTCTLEITGAGIVNAYEAYLAVKPSELDTDGDGIPDSQDACPAMYGTYCNGCPEPPCSGCQSPSCPTTGAPICVDDDSLCTAPNAVGTCTGAICSYTCNSGYGNCDSDWANGCEVDLTTDSDNCGACGSHCGTINCPDNGCGVGGCTKEQYGTYPATQQTSCIDSICSGKCTATCEYNATCDPDDDNDGVLDVNDACPTTYGTACHGCPNPCSGCAVMNCPAEIDPPTCEAGICPDIVCPADGCGVGTCASNESGTYAPAANTCEIVDNVGTCTENLCTLECVFDPGCAAPVKCWSASYKYLWNGDDDDENQLKKFCKCAQGDYACQGYINRTSRRTKTAYWYTDSENNTKWDTTSDGVFGTVYKVKCSDGVYYRTNKDYFYTE